MENLWLEIKLLLGVLTTPTCWLQNNKYNKKYDKWLRARIKDTDFVMNDNFTLKVGDKELWIENHPYDSFTPYRPKMSIRASRRTILLAHDKLTTKWVKNEIN